MLFRFARAKSGDVELIQPNPALHFVIRLIVLGLLPAFSVE